MSDSKPTAHVPALTLTANASDLKAARRRTSSGAVLHVVYPRGCQNAIELDKVPLVLGRWPTESPSAIIDDDTMSRSHARLTWDASWKSHGIADLSSKNGCRVGDRPLSGDEIVALSDGDVVQLGDVLAVYELPAPSPSDDGRGVKVPGPSSRAVALRRAVQLAAGDVSPVLITGETGTGKEYVTREVHRLSGRTGPLVAVNCATLDSQLVESELFGHRRGAFTGATTDHDGFFRAADGGTLMLDEIGELPANTQAKLLRVIEEGEVRPVGATAPVTVDVRIVGATNRDLDDEVEAGRFRRDLLARLAMWEIELPPLRQRRADIIGWLDLLDAARATSAQVDAATPIELSPAAASRLLRASWRENLRGINRLLHHLRAARADADETVSAGDLPDWLETHEPGPVDPAASDTAPASRRPRPSPEEFTSVWHELGENVAKTARHYGRNRTQIYRWLRAYGLRDE